MKLVSVRVTNYKSIEDSGEVKIDNVTCLVGKNESGKTAFLQALQKLSPVRGVSGKFDLTEYPRKDYNAYKRTHDSDPAVAVTATFELSPEEISQIEAQFGMGVLRSKQVAAYKKYDNSRSWQFEVNERATVDKLLSDVELPGHILSQINKSNSIFTMTRALEAIDDRPPSAEDLLSRLKSDFKTSVYAQIVNEHLVRSIPRFVYFSDYSIMQGRISIQDLLKRRDDEELEDADRTFLALLGLVGAELEELEKESNYEHLTAELEGASNRLTDEVFKYWSQNKQLAVKLALSNANPSDPPPLDEGAILNVRIENQRHRVTVPFDERSRGFVWFFSFLAYFSELEDEKYDLVLLLDEPGLSLHAKAQGDFLRLIDERLAPRHQVVYTTHSPFMIDPSNLERVRTVQDTDETGTVVSGEVLSKDRDTVFPLQAALGYELAQTLFLGPNSLLVEGTSDLVYLKALSRAIQAQGGLGLDDRWVIVPVGGGDKAATFVSLLGANQLNVAVLMDVSTKDEQRIKNLQDNKLLGVDRLVQLSEFTGSKDSDIEDMFEISFYIQLVNGAYGGKLSKKLLVKDLPTAGSRIVPKLETLFKSESGADGKFDHYEPAEYLLNNQKELLPKLSQPTLDRFGALFDRVNSLLRRN